MYPAFECPGGCISCSSNYRSMPSNREDDCRRPDGVGVPRERSLRCSPTQGCHRQHEIRKPERRSSVGSSHEEQRWNRYRRCPDSHGVSRRVHDPRLRWHPCGLPHVGQWIALIGGTHTMEIGDTCPSRVRWTPRSRSPNPLHLHHSEGPLPHLHTSNPSTRAAVSVSVGQSELQQQAHGMPRTRHGSQLGITVPHEGPRGSPARPSTALPASRCTAWSRFHLLTGWVSSQPIRAAEDQHTTGGATNHSNSIYRGRDRSQVGNVRGSPITRNSTTAAESTCTSPAQAR